MPVSVTLYTKPGCHLCEDVEKKLADVRTRTPFELVSVDILTDPQLQQEYGFDIPVVLVDGAPYSSTFLNETAFEKFLKEVNSK